MVRCANDNINYRNFSYRKTALAQRLLEEYKYPYLSLDHLKMGLIRSGNTGLVERDVWIFFCPIRLRQIP